MPEDNFQLNTPALPGTVMPFSAEAEQAVLGAVLLEPDCLSTVAEMLPIITTIAPTKLAPKTAPQPFPCWLLAK